MKVLFNALTTNKYQKIKQNQQVAFKGFDCPTDSFELKQIYNLPCPSCSYPMLRQDQIDDFVNTVQNKKGQDLINAIGRYDKYLHEEQFQAAAAIMEEASRSPQLNIQDISKKILASQCFNRKQDLTTRLEDIRSMFSNLPAQQKAACNAIIDEYIAGLDYQDKPINPETLSERITSQIKNQISLTKRIDRKIKKINDFHQEESPFFQKYGNKSQAEIISRLVTPSLITCEHIKPKASGGADNTANYLAECQECNSNRGDKPFSQWVMSVPNFVSNFKKYLEAVALKLEIGELSFKYSDYLTDIVQSVIKETNGKVRVQAPKVAYIQPVEDEQDMSLDQCLLRYKRKIDLQKQELESLREQVKEGKAHEQFPLVVEYQTLTKQKASLTRACRDQESIASSKNDLLKRCYRKVNERTEKRNEIIAGHLSDKKVNEIKNQIKRIDSFLETKNIPEIEEPYEAAKNELALIRQKLSQVNASLTRLEGLIVFPKAIQDKITEKKAQESRITELLRKEKAQEQPVAHNTLVEQISSKEQELAQLATQNAQINTSSSTGKEVLRYRRLLTLISRIEVIVDAYESAKGKLSAEDNEVFDFAREKIQEEIDGLVADKPSVQYQINLDKIAQISADIQRLYAELEKSREQREAQIAIEENIAKYENELSDIKVAIDELTAQLEIAKKVFLAAGIELTIESMQERISKSEQVLLDFEQGKMTQDEFMQEFMSA